MQVTVTVDACTFELPAPDVQAIYQYGKLMDAAKVRPVFGLHALDWRDFYSTLSHTDTQLAHTWLSI